MIESVRAQSGRTSWVMVCMAIAVLLPASGAAQSVERGRADATGVTSATAAGVPGRHDPAHAESAAEPVRPLHANRSTVPAPADMRSPASAGAGRPSWRSPAARDRLAPRHLDRLERLSWEPLDVVDGPAPRADDPHPLRGGLATFGGMLAGFGVGLAVDEPAAGLLVGTGVGLVTTAVLRTFGDR